MRTLIAALLTLLCLSPAHAQSLNSFATSSSITVSNSGVNVRGFHYDASGSAGHILFRSPPFFLSPATYQPQDVTSGSRVMHTISTAGVDGNVWVELPEPGLHFQAGLYITLYNVDQITLFYR